jgi:hypothetical protein
MTLRGLASSLPGDSSSPPRLTLLSLSHLRPQSARSWPAASRQWRRGSVPICPPAARKDRGSHYRHCHRDRCLAPQRLSPGCVAMAAPAADPAGRPCRSAGGGAPAPSAIAARRTDGRPPDARAWARPRPRHRPGRRVASKGSGLRERRRRQQIGDGEREEQQLQLGLPVLGPAACWGAWPALGRRHCRQRACAGAAGCQHRARPSTPYSRVTTF